MMTKKEVDNWCLERMSSSHRLVYNTENYVKYEWDNGDIYEIKIVEWSVNRKESHIFINGELVHIIKS